MLTTFVDHLYLNNLNLSKCAVSSCVTNTPLNLLVTALDGRCDVSCFLLLMHARVCFVVIDACSLIAFQCLPTCVLPRVPSETLRACDQLHLRNSTYQQARTIHYS